MYKVNMTQNEQLHRIVGGLCHAALETVSYAYMYDASIRIER